MRMIKKNQKRLMVMSIVLFMICAMALGYAALSASLKINGIGTISTSWDILFTRIEEKSSRGVSSNQSEITDKLTATFDVNIDAPGNFIEYNVTLKNNGNIDAVIESIGGIVEANGEAPTGIQFGIRGIRIGDDLLAGSEKTFIVRAEIPTSETVLPTGSKVLELKVNVRQKDIDSSGLVTTFKDCFQTNEAGDTITKYLCGKNNTNGYSEILDVTIPSEIDGKAITAIGPSAFQNQKITTVKFPVTITKIENLAFHSNLLTTVEIPESVTVISTGAFGSNHLTRVSLPSTLTSIGDSAFLNNKLATLTIPDQVTSISSNAFAANLLTSITIPSSVRSLGSSVFANNQMPDDQAFIYNRKGDGSEDKTSLNSYAGRKRDHVVIPSQVKKLGISSLANCSIERVTLPPNLLVIESLALLNNKLTEISLPDTLQEIASLGFSTNELELLVIPASVSVIGERTFQNNHLQQVEFKGDVPNRLGYTIFDASLGEMSHAIKVPAGTLEQYKTAEGSAGGLLYSPSKTWFGQDDHDLLNASYE